GTVAMSIHNAQKNQQGWLKFNIFFTLLCAAAFIVIKFTFEYTPKWSGDFFVLDPALHHHLDSGKTALAGLVHFGAGCAGKRSCALFPYPFSDNLYDPMWWSLYYVATAIRASHVIVGGALLTWVLVRAFKGPFAPGHYNAVEIVGLYWHIVDM